MKENKLSEEQIQVMSAALAERAVAPIYAQAQEAFKLLAEQYPEALSKYVDKVLHCNKYFFDLRINQLDKYGVPTSALPEVLVEYGSGVDPQKIVTVVVQLPPENPTG